MVTLDLPVNIVSNGGARMIQDVQLTFSDGRIEVITHDGKRRRRKFPRTAPSSGSLHRPKREKVNIVDERYFCGIRKAS